MSSCPCQYVCGGVDQVDAAEIIICSVQLGILPVESEMSVQLRYADISDTHEQLQFILSTRNRAEVSMPYKIEIRVCPVSV